MNFWGLIALFWEIFGIHASPGFTLYLFTQVTISEANPV